MPDTVTINELNELRQFIVDAFYRFDPSVDTSPGSLADVSVISPIILRQSPDPFATDIESFIRTRLRSEFPDLSVEPGEPIDDYLVKPLRVVLAPYRRMIDLIKSNQSLADPAALSDEEADNLGANYFTPRKQGGFSVGIARLYFSQPQAVTITPSNVISTATGLRFFPSEVQSIRPDNMIFNLEKNLYYFDVVVRAELVGNQYNIAPDSLVTIENIPNAVRVTNKVTFVGGGSTENTISYIARLEQSLTEKTLVTVRGIVARLSDVFSSIRAIRVIGYGDPEMQRDIIKGSGEPVTYAYLRAEVLLGSPDTLAASVVNDGNPHHATLEDIGVEVGDTVFFNYWEADRIDEVTVTEVIDPMRLRVTPNLPVFSLSERYSLAKPGGLLTLSDIPAGVLDTDTPAGPLTIKDGEVHIGGQVDVYVRGEAPQERSTNLASVRDALPLHFGLDLESFGESEDQWIHITPAIDDLVQGVTTDRDGNTVTDHLLIRARAGGYTPWEASEEDVGRFIQLLGPDLMGTYEILEFLGREEVSGILTTRVRINLTNVDTGTPLTILDTGSPPDQKARIRKKESVKRLVRDRDNSRSGAGIDFDDLGVEIGDSVVIETGDDAGTYTVRRILSSLGDFDSLLLDRDLTKTVRPSGSGNYSGLRYRINDELDIDLVQPQVTKIPLGEIFHGNDLSIVAGSDTVLAGTESNFVLAGIEVNDTLEVMAGDNKGQYQIVAVTPYTMKLSTTMRSTAFSVGFQVYTKFTGVTRPMVRVKRVELLDSNFQPSGVNLPYGKEVDVRVLGSLSNKAEGKSVESYGGFVTDYTTNRLYDNDFNFEARGVLVEDRLTIYNSSNVGDYTIKDMGDTGGSAPYWIELVDHADGGKNLRVNTTGIHYQTGVASAGIARFFFVEPTSVEFHTGLSGGRVKYGEGSAERMFRFSTVDGKILLPPQGAEEELPRDLRVVRSYSYMGEDHTILELTDPSMPDVFGLELQEGDIVEVHEQIPFRDNGGDTFEDLGLFGSPAGLRTLAGSSLVSVPSSSLIDFTQMGNLPGQLLFIEDGPDKGQYRIEEVVNAKALRLDKALSSTTATIVSQDTGRDATLVDGPGAGESTLEDTGDPGALGTQVGYHITIFESTDTRVEGTHEIKAVPPTPPYESVTLDLEIDADVTPPDSFSWVRTVGKENIAHVFRLYQAIPLQLAIEEVATVELDVIGSEVGNITGSHTIDIPDATGVSIGDRLEILSGAAVGAYTIVNIVVNTLTVAPTSPFPVTGTGFPFRIRGGIYGAKRMITVGSWKGGSGIVEPGYNMPFRIIRSWYLRVSSTEMEKNFDGSLYYVDVQIESDGAGDVLNLERDTRLQVSSGVQVDGYLYRVENNVLSFSSYEQMWINLRKRFLPVGNSDAPENQVEVSGRNFRIVYETSSLTNLVNNLIRSDSERVVTSSSIARHMLPAYVFMTLTYRGGEGQEIVGKAIEDYINGLPTSEELEISDIEAFATRKGANSVEHPIHIVVVVHDLDRSLIVDRSDNKIGGISVPYNGTSRITTYFAKIGAGLNVVREG